ncbi:1860_t:CDS:2 [Rhizophagus irregularis]|nr:1860_t:CDS:2 [Rhizophagus irregularis]
MFKSLAFLLILTFTLMIATLSLSFPTSQLSADELISSTIERRATSPFTKLISNKSVFTYYWVANEVDHKSNSVVTLKDCKKRTVATVNRDFAIEMKTEGSGRGKSGDVFNFDANGNALRPFITVAANDLRPGQLLFIPALVDLALPGGKRHNGCVIVEDRGHGFGGKHIDFFVASESTYKTLDKQKSITNVQVFDGTASDGKKCTLQNYTV